MTARAPTSTPSSSALPAPTNASSSTMTGRAPGGSSTPPIVTPAARWTRDPIWAHDPTRTWESTIVSGPTQAPTFRYEGGMTTTPSPRWTPRLTAVPPGTIRHGPPARSVRGGTAARSRKVRGPTVQSTEIRSAKRARIAAFTSGRTRQPSAAVGSGSAARRRPASRSSRTVLGSIASEELPRVVVPVVMRRPRAKPRAPRSGRRSPRRARAPGASRRWPPARVRRAAAAAPAPCRSRAGP